MRSTTTYSAIVNLTGSAHLCLTRAMVGRSSSSTWSSSSSSSSSSTSSSSRVGSRASDGGSSGSGGSGVPFRSQEEQLSLEVGCFLLSFEFRLGPISNSTMAM